MVYIFSNEKEILLELDEDVSSEDEKILLKNNFLEIRNKRLMVMGLTEIIIEFRLKIPQVECKISLKLSIKISDKMALEK